MPDYAVQIASALFLAFSTESLTEYLFGTLADKITALKPYKWLLMYVAAIVGVGLCFWYQLDLVELIRGGEATWPGMLLSGLSVGRGANYINDLVSKYIKP
jgi:hypothetical protein